MKKLLVTSVLLVFTHFGFSQTKPMQVSVAPDNPGLNTVLLNAVERQAFESDSMRGQEEFLEEDDRWIRTSGLRLGYSDLMNIYNGRSLQLVEVIESGEVFRSPSQSVLKKPFESTVFS